MKTLTEFSGVLLRRAAELCGEKPGDPVSRAERVAAVAAALSLSEERASRLLEALEVVAAALAEVRLVRVFTGEDAPAGAQRIGEYYYVVDRFSAPRRSRNGSGRTRRSGKGEGRGRKEAGFPPRRDAAPGRTDGAPLRRGEKMPMAGEGWSLTRAPRDTAAEGDRAKPRPPRKGRKPPEGRGERPGHGANGRRRASNRVDQESRPGGAGPVVERRAGGLGLGRRPEAGATSDDGRSSRAKKASKRRRKRGDSGGPGVPSGERRLGRTGPRPGAAKPVDPARRGSPDEQVNGNLAPPPAADVNGNLALPPPSPVDDDIGNR